MSSQNQIHQKYRINLRENKNSSVQLYIIPHAGGNYSQYLSWNKHIDPNLETIFLELPCRGVNFNDQENQVSWSEFIEKSFNLIEDQDKTAIFFGHSFGSLIAFELIKMLERKMNFKNCILITSACFAPTQSNLENMEPISRLNESELWNRVKKFGAVTDEMIGKKELSSYFLKGLRSDLNLMENYKSVDESPINCPIHTFIGVEDTIYSLGQMEEWRQFTNSKFQLKAFPGNHFYVFEDSQKIATHVNQIFNKLINEGIKS